MLFLILNLIIKNFKKIILFEKLIFIIIFFNIYIFSKIIKKKEIKIALCTIGKKENLYVKEFVDYYIKLGIDHIFIYDDNSPNTEKMSNIIDSTYNKHVTIYENIKPKIQLQIDFLLVILKA